MVLLFALFQNSIVSYRLCFSRQRIQLWAIVEAKFTKDFYMLKITALLLENDTNIEAKSIFGIHRRHP